MISPRPTLSSQSSGFLPRPATFSRSASFSASATASAVAVAAPDRGAANSFYDDLGLHAGASAREIKDTYRRLARAVHLTSRRRSEGIMLSSQSFGFFSRSTSFSRPASFSAKPPPSPPSPLPQAPTPLSAPFSRSTSLPRPATFSRSASATASAVAVAAPDRGAANSFYDVLGLHAGASGRVIKAAYRRLARAVHPDVAPEPTVAKLCSHLSKNMARCPGSIAEIPKPKKKPCPPLGAKN